MSFVNEDDVFAVGEVVMAEVWRACAGREIERPFPRLSYREAMERYGSDKPDLRIPWQIADLTSGLVGSDFRVFQAVKGDGGRIRGFCVPGGARLSRKQLDGLGPIAQAAGAPGVLWAKATGSELQGGFIKHLSASESERLRERLATSDGDLLVIVAAGDEASHGALDALRRHLADLMEAVEPGDRFLWVTEFPLFERDPKSGEPVPSHHPFTSFNLDDLEKLRSSPLEVRSRAYDLVYNGTELGSGSIRINEPDLQRRVLSVLGIGPEEAQRKFGFLLEAFKYGAPPHGGFALGLDRVVMHLAGGSSLRDVIAFPKTTAARALMEGAPAPISAEELEELGLKLTTETHA